MVGMKETSDDILSELNLGKPAIHAFLKATVHYACYSMALAGCGMIEHDTGSVKGEEKRNFMAFFPLSCDNIV